MYNITAYEKYINENYNKFEGAIKSFFTNNPTITIKSWGKVSKKTSKHDRKIYAN